jgi:hypothetical protein
MGLDAAKVWASNHHYVAAKSTTQFGKMADRIISTAKDVNEYLSQHPNARRVALIAPMALPGIIGGVGGLSGGPLGVAAGATGAIVSHQAYGYAFDALLGERLRDLSQYSISKGASLIQRHIDPTLSHDQALALSTAAIISAMSAKSLKRDAQSFASAIRQIATPQQNLVRSHNILFNTSHSNQAVAVQNKAYFIDQEQIYIGKTAVAKFKENPMLGKNYLKQMQDITTIKLEKKQLWFLGVALRSDEFHKLPTDLVEAHRANFKSRLKKLRAEWSQHTGKPWPTYQQKYFKKDGKLWKDIGDPYDAHHIIQANHGGPNQWWNLHPSHFLDEHPKIHGKDSAARKIFNNTKKD